MHWNREKTIALMTAAKTEVSMEMSRDYLVLLADRETLPEEVRRVARELLEVVAGSVSLVGQISERIDTLMPEDLEAED